MEDIKNVTQNDDGVISVKANFVDPDEVDDPVVDDDEVGLIIDQAEVERAKKKEVEANTEPEEKQRGVILDKKVIHDNPIQKKGIVVGATANKQSMDDIGATLNEMESDIEEQRAIAEKAIKEGKTLNKEIRDPKASEAVKNANSALNNAKQNGTESAKKSNEDEVTILIDKIGLGSFKFTDEEKERIEYSKKIRLVEVEDKSLRSIKIKKKVSNKGDYRVLKRTFDKSFSPVIAMASGYTCKMKNISASEAIRMYQAPGEDTANSIVDKWSAIYDRITDISTGPFKDFDDFCRHTAFMDYDSFLYGMICSSYPENDEIPFNCDTERGGCGKDFSRSYNNKEMIRSDLISEAGRKVMSDIISNAAFVDKAKEYATTKSPVNVTTRFMLDDSMTIVEIYVPSVHDMIERVFRPIEKNRDLAKQENRANLVLAQGINAIFAPDYETFDPNDPDSLEYIEIQGTENIIEHLSHLNEKEINIIARQIQKLTEPLVINFGFKEIKCPHCGHNWGRYDIELDQILFRRVQQRVSTEIE
jgi:hypothetical protein